MSKSIETIKWFNTEKGYGFAAEVTSSNFQNVSVGIPQVEPSQPGVPLSPAFTPFPFPFQPFSTPISLAGDTRIFVFLSPEKSGCFCDILVGNITLKGDDQLHRIMF